MATRAQRVALAFVVFSTPAWAGWSIRIASWNLLNFGDSKAGLNPVANRQALLTKYATVVSQYDIVFLQEILNNGQSVTVALAGMPQLANYNCQTISAASGRAGRQEHYSVCYTTIRPPNGGTLVLNNTWDYMVQGGPYIAVNGTNQTAQNVWMRPPLYANFTFTPPPGEGAAFTFGVYSSHTKPSYGGQPRPPGTPANAAANSSVTNELTSIQTNVLGAVPNFALIGDLNADCASYPQAYRGLNFPGPFTWYINYGERTNTAPLSSCAYDRIILNPGMNAVYLGHDIYTQGIAAPRLDNQRVSDHMLVWVEIGVRNKQKLITSTATAVPIPAAKRQRRMTNASSGGTPVNINGSGLSVPTGGTAPKLFVIAYNQANYFEGNRSIPLTDVRGAPTPVTVNTNGTLNANVVWNNPTNGAYSVVLDVDGDGVYNKYAGDIATYNNEIDFIVDDGTAHSQVMSLDDNGNARELFNENSARHVYGLIRNLTAGASVNVYVVANKLLPQPWPGWAAMRQQGTLNLASVAVPVNVLHGPLIVPNLTAADKLQTETVGPDGSLFTSIWDDPYKLYNMRALMSAPPVPDYKPQYDDQDGDEDPCENAWQSTDANFQAVCNVGSLFTDYYGTQFSIVVDVNQDGIFDDGDLVDVHDIGDMSAYFNTPGNTTLGPNANGNAAVDEYKEFLNSKLTPNPPLTHDNIYDTNTQLASTRYLCTPTLSNTQFQTIVTPGSQTGLRILDQEDYSTVRNLGTGVYSFVDSTMDQLNVAANSQVCMAGDTLHLTDATINQNSTLVAQTDDSLTVKGSVQVQKNSTACAVAEYGFTLTAGAAVGVVFDPEPITKAGFIFAAAGGALVSAVAGAICSF
jgi:hypothetical protein